MFRPCTTLDTYRSATDVVIIFGAFMPLSGHRLHSFGCWWLCEASLLETSSGLRTVPGLGRFFTQFHFCKTVNSSKWLPKRHNVHRQYMPKMPSSKDPCRSSSKKLITRNLIKKPWAFIRVPYNESYYFGVIGPGFLNQVSTLV